VSRRWRRPRRLGSSAMRRRASLHVAEHRTKVAGSERAAISAMMMSSGSHAAFWRSPRRPPLLGETGTTSPPLPAMDRFVEDEEGLGFACQYDRGLGWPLAAVITKRFCHERKLGLTDNLGRFKYKAPSRDDIWPLESRA